MSAPISHYLFPLRLFVVLTSPLLLKKQVSTTMHHQLLVFGGFLALAFSEPVPGKLLRELLSQERLAAIQVTHYRAALPLCTCYDSLYAFIRNTDACKPNFTLPSSLRAPTIAMLPIPFRPVGLSGQSVSARELGPHRPRQQVPVAILQSLALHQ